jgi:hypothetical protein
LAVVPLSDRERAGSIGLAVLAIAAVVAIHTNTVATAIGAALALYIGFTAWTRRRVPCAVATFVFGLGSPWWGDFILFGAIYVLWGFNLVRTGRAGGAPGS